MLSYARPIADIASTCTQSEHSFRPKGETAVDALEYMFDLADKYTSQRGHKVRQGVLSS